MREDDGVGFGVRHVEGAAEGVAELVVQRHADGAETGAAEPGAVEGFLARGHRGGGRDDVGEGGGEGLGAFECEEGDDRVGVAGVESFDCWAMVSKGCAGGFQGSGVLIYQRVRWR